MKNGVGPASVRACPPTLRMTVLTSCSAWFFIRFEMLSDEKTDEKADRALSGLERMSRNQVQNEGADEGIRTPDPCFTKALLYP
jgi:hypothetical protein